MKILQSTGLLNSIGFLAILGIILSPNLSSAADKSKKLRLAYSGWEIGTAVSYVGVDSGLFKKYDVDIEELPIRDTFSAGVQSLLGVDLLIGFGNPLARRQPVGDVAVISLVGWHCGFDHF